VSERISRKADQKVYQSRIHSRRIRELYYVKEMTGRPMTVLVDEAIALYLSSVSYLPKLMTDADQGQKFILSSGKID
jgi:hypothetical protein